MKLFKRLFKGLLYSMPFLGTNIFIGYLLLSDPRAQRVLYAVGYFTLGIYFSIIAFIVILSIIIFGLVAIRYLFKIRLKAEITGVSGKAHD